jgi:hypothetical protein
MIELNSVWFCALQLKPWRSLPENPKQSVLVSFSVSIIYHEIGQSNNGKQARERDFLSKRKKSRRGRSEPITEICVVVEVGIPLN